MTAYELKIGIYKERLSRIDALREEKKKLSNKNFTTIENDEKLLKRIESINCEISIIQNMIEGDR